MPELVIIENTLTIPSKGNLMPNLGTYQSWILDNRRGRFNPLPAILANSYFFSATKIISGES